MPATSFNPTFAFYRLAAVPTVCIQLIDLDTGEPVTARELLCYRVKSPIETPFFKVRLQACSRLLLTPAAAAPLLASGKIEILLPEILIPHRKGFEAPETTSWAPGPRRPLAHHEDEKISRENTPVKAGMPAPAGGEGRLKAGTPASARKR